MGNFNRGDRSDRSGGKRSFGRRDFGSRGGSDRSTVMHKAICSNCGNECEVPFRPTSGKPVYCSNCFEKNNRNFDSDRPERRSYDRPNFENRGSRPSQDYKRDFEALNSRLDQILKILTPEAVATPKVLVKQKTARELKKEKKLAQETSTKEE